MQSLQEQTYQDLEIIAVDDGSADATRPLLERWSATDARVRVLAQRARGLVAALETAAAAAAGEILVRMDADDIAHPDRIARQVALFEREPQVGACGTLVQYFPRADLGGGARRYEQWINSAANHDDMVRDIFIECPIAHPSLAIRRHALELAGGYRDLAWPEDYDLVLRLWRCGVRFAKVPEILLLWRERPDRASRTDRRYSQAAFTRCKVHHLRRTLLAQASAVVWGAGPVGKTFARELLRQGGSVHAFVDLDPRRIGQQIHGVPVISPEQALPLPGLVALAAVAQPGARAEIRAVTRRLGWTEGIDFLAIA